MKKNIIDWIKKNQLEAFVLAAVLLLSSYLRLFRIGDYMTFLGDEGRDVIVVRRLLVDFDPILVGPGTSIGNMYLGPIYYYLMAPFLLLANFSPVGPAVMIALLGILTTLFVWKISREWFGKLSAFVAVILYTVSPVIITYSRSSWNPNIMPFFALLCIYSIWRVWNFNQMKWLIVFGASFAFVMQSHYLGLLLLPTAGLFWLTTYFKNKKSEKITKNLLKNSIIGGILFLTLMSPLIIFDYRHGWRNFEAIKIFFTERQTTVSARPWTAIPKLFGIWTKIINRLVTGFNDDLAKFFSFFTSIFLLAFIAANLKRIKEIYIKPKKHKVTASFLLLSVWILVSLIGFGIYKQEIYDHYFGIIFPAVVILIGAIFQLFYDKNKFVGLLLTIVFIPILVPVNLTQNPLKYPPNNQLQRSINVSEKIEREAGGEKFNLAVIAERNYEGAYQYFLEKNKTPIVMIDPQREKETVADQLFVVCELPKDDCNVVNNPKAGIANFGWSEIEKEWDISGVVLYKLIHYKGD